MERELDANSEVYKFFKNLDRSIFIEGENKQYAEYDRALPIGFEQTISQPTLVYAMTEELELDQKCRVLEIGTGSGYQTAFLARFSGEVYTVEKIKELSWKAVERIMKLGFENVNFKIGDGSEGWEEYAPYDRIVVTAAPAEIPEPLVTQLKQGGKMLIPVGKKGAQELLLIRKDHEGKIEREPLGEVKFVELKGEYGGKN